MSSLKSKPYFQKLTSLLLLLGVFQACKKQDSSEKTLIKRELIIIDSLYLLGESEKGTKMLQKLGPKININELESSTYYYLSAALYRNEPLKMERYADSALLFFSSDKRKSAYRDEYFKALLLKGESSIINQKYNSALNYYYLGKSLVDKGYCDHGILAAKMASLYYTQRNYELSANYWKASIKGIENCKDSLDFKKVFGLKQGAYNNAGFSYQLAGKMDSALYYYQKDLNLITATQRKYPLGNYYIVPAKMSLYDNLGGIMIEKGKLAEAEKYLYECVGMATKDVDGVRIPPFLKIAEVHLLRGDYKQAELAFAQCKKLLDRFSRSNTNSTLKYYHLYAKLKNLTNQPQQAYNYEEKYVKLKDTVEESSSRLYRLNVDGQLKSLHQEQMMNELTHESKLKQVYLTGVIIIAIMILLIMLLFFRNLKNSRKNYKESILNNDQLHQALIELERINKSHLRIMQVMAHDLRNPMSGINGLSSLLLADDNFSEDQRKILSLIESTSINSMHMLNELLKSGLSEDNGPMQKEPLEIGNLLLDSIKLLAFKAKEKNQHISFIRDEQPLTLQANRDKIWRVFNNLIVNAIKFSHQGGLIKIEIVNKKEKILISIEDEGIGISQEDQMNVFEMFSPAKKIGTNGEQPFGLGLSISKKIIEKHHGRIWFTSKPDQGTTFYIELPI